MLNFEPKIISLYLCLSMQQSHLYLSCRVFVVNKKTIHKKTIKYSQILLIFHIKWGRVHWAATSFPWSKLLSVFRLHGRCKRDDSSLIYLVLNDGHIDCEWQQLFLKNKA